MFCYSKVKLFDQQSLSINEYRYKGYIIREWTKIPKQKDSPCSLYLHIRLEGYYFRTIPNNTFSEICTTICKHFTYTKRVFVPKIWIIFYLYTEPQLYNVTVVILVYWYIFTMPFKKLKQIQMIYCKYHNIIYLFCILRGKFRGFFENFEDTLKIFLY